MEEQTMTILRDYLKSLEEEQEKSTQQNQALAERMTKLAKQNKHLLTLIEQCLEQQKQLSELVTDYEERIQSVESENIRLLESLKS